MTLIKYSGEQRTKTSETRWTVAHESSYRCKRELEKVESVDLGRQMSANNFPPCMREVLNSIFNWETSTGYVINIISGRWRQKC